MTIATIRRRIAAITAIVRPAASLDAKLEELTPEQRAAYRYWQDRSNAWHRDYPGGEAYRMLLNGNPGPTLRHGVRTALFGHPATIPADATERQAADAYRKLIAGE